MILGYARGYHLMEQLARLEEFPVEEIFSDNPSSSSQKDDWQALLSFAKEGDELIITSWEVLSRDYEQLLGHLDELSERDITLQVLDFPEWPLEDWRNFFLWSLRNERLIHPRLISLGKEQARHKEYSFFSRDIEARQLYRRVIKQLIEKQSVRAIAYHERIPLETVYRIKQEVNKVQLAGVLTLCFFLAIFSIKLVETYFEQLWLQILICLFMVGIILVNILTDNEKEKSTKKKQPSKEKKSDS